MNMFLRYIYKGNDNEIRLKLFPYTNYINIDLFEYFAICQFQLDILGFMFVTL